MNLHYRIFGLPDFDDVGTDLIVGVGVGICVFCWAGGGIKFCIASSGHTDRRIKLQLFRDENLTQNDAVHAEYAIRSHS